MIGSSRTLMVMGNRAGEGSEVASRHMAHTISASTRRRNCGAAGAGACGCGGLA